MTFARPDGTAVVTCKVQLSSDADAYQVTGIFSASWDDQIVKTHEWNLNIARTHT
jgi:hypothetical protein